MRACSLHYLFGIKIIILILKMQIFKYELYKSLLFIDKQAFFKSNTLQSINESVSLIVSIAGFKGIAISTRQKHEIQRSVQIFISKIQLKLSNYSYKYNRFELKEENLTSNFFL